LIKIEKSMIPQIGKLNSFKISFDYEHFSFMASFTLQSLDKSLSLELEAFCSKGYKNDDKYNEHNMGILLNKVYGVRIVNFNGQIKSNLKPDFEVDENEYSSVSIDNEYLGRDDDIYLNSRQL